MWTTCWTLGEARQVCPTAGSWASRRPGPSFEGGLSVSRIEEARIRLKEMEARGSQVALEYRAGSESGNLGGAGSGRKNSGGRRAQTWAEKALGEVRQIYSRQAATVDSLLQAEVAWNQAEVAYTAALYEGRIAQAFLRRALGDFADELRVESSE